MSPKGAAWMQYRQSSDGVVTMWWTGAMDRQGNGWKATFTPNTPMHMAQAFSDKLASPDPTMRPRGRVPAECAQRSATGAGG
ncbi:DUF317 domain-containing protein [Streptomyces sp. NPDC047024]|uniref:DUF317 domain-containing protein n=1 Tax=Streptomyces sp. NPDC047024 TaxID=3155476 RepID=UPI0033E198F1